MPRTTDKNVSKRGALSPSFSLTQIYLLTFQSQQLSHTFTKDMSNTSKRPKQSSIFVQNLIYRIGQIMLT